MIEYVLVRIGGGYESVQAMLSGLPMGDYQVEDRGDDRYLVATNNARFLRFAIAKQGYGEVLDMA